MPASTGYGEPIQSLFKFKDGEKVVAALSLDPRGGVITSKNPEVAPPVHAVAVTSDGYSLRFSLEPFVEPSTRAGRRFARVAEGAEVVGVAADHRAARSSSRPRVRRARCSARRTEINFLGGPGRGVILIKLQKQDDRLLGFIASTGDRDLMTVETTRGAEQTISTAKYEVTGRGGKGRELLQRGQFTRVVPRPVEAPVTENGG